jgi:hypothetical protein
MTRDSKVKAADAPDTVCRVRDGKCKACLSGNTRDLTEVKQVRSRGLPPCTGGCGVRTRNSHMKAADHPGTKVRLKGGMCGDCRRAQDPDWAEAQRERERQRKLPVEAVIDTDASRQALEHWLASRRPKRTQHRRTA